MSLCIAHGMSPMVNARAAAPYLVCEQQPTALCSCQDLVAAALQHTQAHTHKGQACSSTTGKHSHMGLYSCC